MNVGTVSKRDAIAFAALTGVLGAALAHFLTRKQMSKLLRIPTHHPAWKPGQPQPGPYHDMPFITVDPEQLGGTATYPLIISAAVPRPIAFVSSVSADNQVHNLAPYSYFNAVAHDPPHVAIGMCHTQAKEGGKKDSLRNILESKEFVVNIISDWFIEAANHTCGMFEYGVNEMQLTGLTPVPSKKVAPPRVLESAVHMECKLVHTYEVTNSSGAVSTTVVIGKVVLLHVNEGVAGSSPSGKLVVDFAKLRPVSRLGGNTYGEVKQVYDLPRPDRST